MNTIIPTMFAINPTITTEESPMNTIQPTIQPTTNQEAINMQDVNKQALLSTMAAELLHAGLSPRHALITATAWIGALDYLDDAETLLMAIEQDLGNIELQVTGDEGWTSPAAEFRDVKAALREAGYITANEEVGTRFAELVSLRKEAYAPVLASEGITRRHNYAPVKTSSLFIEAIHALESTEYTVDTYMLQIARAVVAATGGNDNDPEGYVLRGSERMDANEAYISEYKGDRRLRMYQASCQGPMGAASDRSRSLMNLSGVTMDYDVDVVIPALRAEMADMVNAKGAEERAQLIKDAVNDPVAFIVNQLYLAKTERETVGKPYSFVKAAKLWVELNTGQRPYLGMAVGLDAKCSGPQLAGLMAGDQGLAAACGFTLTEVEDAYERAIVQLEKAGIYGLTRADIKKPYMGIFYGQGWAAFLDGNNMSSACYRAVHGSGVPTEGAAKAFHKAVTASFGARVLNIRAAFREYQGKVAGAISYNMPCGTEVKMNYKQKVNILGEAMDTVNGVGGLDVVVTNNMETYRFPNYLMPTKEVATDDHVRNGFVNMIQATDAMLARLIIVNLKRMGAQHIICIHDCFRVNMTEIHILEAAIKKAYKDLFCSTKNEATDDMPLGTDILGLYFKGINSSLVAGESGRTMSQFFENGVRRLMKINGERVSTLVDELGTSYYFAK